jgi:hypothetical protein
VLDFAQFLELQTVKAGTGDQDYTEDDARPDALLATEESQRLLEKMANEALSEIEAGQARPLTLEHDDMLPECDFAGGVRGRHYVSCREGHTVEVHKADGTTDVDYFTLEDGAVMLEPDVRQYFPDSDAVNRRLRVLISLVPEKRQVSGELIGRPTRCRSVFSFANNMHTHIQKR